MSDNALFLALLVVSIAGFCVGIMIGLTISIMKGGNKNEDS